MSHNDKRFPEIQIYPQPISTYKIIEPYVDFVADLEADKVRTEVHSLRSQTTPVKTRKHPSPAAPVGPPTSVSSPHNRPVSRSPRNIKTAPISSEVRGSLQVIKRPQIIQTPNSNNNDGNTNLNTTTANNANNNNNNNNNIKTPFEKAVESLAAMKLHDYALKRKERMKARYRLWDEIRGTQREMEISGAEQAILEFSEQLAAWKIKYYVELYRKKKSFGNIDDEKRNLIKQIKYLKKKLTSLQKELSDYHELKLDEKNQILLKNKDELELILQNERETINKLHDEIKKYEELKWNLETEIKQKQLENEKIEEDKNQQNQLLKNDIAYAKEELEISRRTAQEYTKIIDELEFKLNNLTIKYNEQCEICTTQHEIKGETNQYEKKIELLTKEIFSLNSKSDKLETNNNELNREINTLKNTVINLTKELTNIKIDKERLENELINNKSDNLNKSIQISSLEKLVTEITVQRDQLRQMAEEGTSTSVMYSSDLQRSQMIIDQKNKEIQHYQRTEIERNELIACIDSKLEKLRSNCDRYGLISEDYLCQIQKLNNILDENNQYSQILESQLTTYRKKEILNSRSVSSSFNGTTELSRLLSPNLRINTNPSINTFDSPTNNNNNKHNNNFEDISINSINETNKQNLLPLEGKLVNLLSLLEDKLNQLDNVVRQVDGQSSSQFSDNTNESQLEDACIKLESLLQEETRRLNNLKLELTTARDSINIAQTEKVKLIETLKRLPHDKYNRKATISSHIEKLQLDLQQKLIDAQNIATEALNSKLECDRLREELSITEEVLEDVKKQRLYSRPSSRSSSSKPSPALNYKKSNSIESNNQKTIISEKSNTIQEDSNDDSGFLTPNGGNSGMINDSLHESSINNGSLIIQNNNNDSVDYDNGGKYNDNNNGDNNNDNNNDNNKPISASSSSVTTTTTTTVTTRPMTSTFLSRPKTQKQFNELQSTNSFGFQSPIQLGRKPSEPIKPKSIGQSEIFEFHTNNSNDDDNNDNNDNNYNNMDNSISNDQDNEFNYNDEPFEENNFTNNNNNSNTNTNNNNNNNNNQTNSNKNIKSPLISQQTSSKSIGLKSPSSILSDQNSITNQSYFSSSKRLNINHSDLSLTNIESPYELLKYIQKKLESNYELLSLLIKRKEISRKEIEKWTLFFLREYGRVPGLAECKYGPNNQIFETFNKIQHDIYACHSEVQELFDYMDSRRLEIIQSNLSLEEKLNELDDIFLDPLLSQQDGEEYEDAYKLHFESVENMLLQGNTESEEVSIHSNYSVTSGIFPTGILNYDVLNNNAKLDVLQNIENDIKEFQKDIEELKISLQDSRQYAEELNEKLKQEKIEIQKWNKKYIQKYGIEPTQETKEMEVSHLYHACHDTHVLLEEELEKMKTFALISAAKSSEIDRLKIIFRKFLRKSPSEISSQYNGHILATGVSNSYTPKSSHSSISIHSSQSFFNSLNERLNKTKKELINNDSNSNFHSSLLEYPSQSETPEEDVLKLTEDLKLLNNYLQNIYDDLNELKLRKNEIKLSFKSWEEKFIEVHSKKPTNEDRKMHLEDLYEEYSAIQEEIIELLQQQENGTKIKEKLEYILELRIKQIKSG